MVIQALVALEAGSLGALQYDLKRKDVVPIHMKDITKIVNEVYKRQNPSTYLSDDASIHEFVENRRQFLLDLKLPARVFMNSSALDLGCGMGMNSLVYDHVGAACTLVEYDSKSFKHASDLFNKFAQNEFHIFNQDLFEFKSDAKFDFVISNGVAQHTRDPIGNIELACEFVDDDGFLILGVGNRAGFFQRGLQRAILFTVSGDEAELVANAKAFFPDHLQRSTMGSGRSVEAVIYDTYVNPKIANFGTQEIIKAFTNCGLTMYSSLYDLGKFDDFFQASESQFKLVNNVKGQNAVSYDDLFLSDFRSFSLSSDSVSWPARDSLRIVLQKAMINLATMTEFVNDLRFEEFSMDFESLLQQVDEFRFSIEKIPPVKVIDVDYNLQFLNEVRQVLELLDGFNRGVSTNHEQLRETVTGFKYLFKGFSGRGMDYYVGHKSRAS